MPALTFTYPFDTPFYTGGAISSDVPYLFPVAIDGHAFLVDLKKYRRTTLPALRPPVDQNIEPGDNSLNNEGFWRRTQSDWSLGAGQVYYDNDTSLYGVEFRSSSDTPTSRRRFFSSKGVDPWTPNQLTLQPDTTLTQASSNTNLKVLSVNGYFYFVDGSTLKHTTTPDAPSWTTVTTTGLSTITGITSNGSTIFVCDGVKVMSSVVGSGTASDLGALAPSLLGYANGRLLGAAANIIYEIAAAGTSTAIKTHDNASFVWNVVAAAPNGIYIGGNTGDRNEIYYVGVNTSTGALLAPVFAMNLPYGETVNAMVHYGGVMLLGTSKGFRVAEIGSSNQLTHGPLIATTSAVTAVEPQGQFAWITCTNYDSTSTGLFRVDLSQFVSTLVPAYATDLMATTQGAVLSIATFASKRYFVVSAVGIYGQSANKVASGSVTSGQIRYGTTERKMVSSIDFKFDVLAGSIDAAVTDNIATTVNIASINTAGSTSAGPLGLGVFNAEAFSVITTLTRSSGAITTGPTLHRWTVRAIATPFRTEEFIVPLILWQKVDDPIGEGQDIYFDPYNEFLMLKQLEADRSVIRYQEGAGTYNVYVDTVEVQPEKWMDEHQFFQGLVVVRMLTVETIEGT